MKEEQVTQNVVWKGREMSGNREIGKIGRRIARRACER